MRTMVFVGEFWEGSTCQGLADGFERAGWAVQRVDIRYHMADAGGDLILRIINRLAFNRCRRNFCRAIVETCRLVQPEVLFTVKGSYIDGTILTEIRTLGIALIMFYPDFHFSYRGTNLETMKLYDIVFTSKSFQLDFLRHALPNRQVEFVHHGFCPSVHRPYIDPMRESDYEYDIMFIGNYSQRKFEWILDLRRRQSARSFGIIGHHWRERAKGTLLEPCIIADKALGIAYAKFIQKARINIAVHTGRVPGSGEWEDLVSTRTFEIPATKGFMLHIDNLEVRSLFEPGSEIDVFSTVETLSNQVDFYLARPQLRATMINRAYRRCAPAYSYDARAQQMTKLM
jgi:spore maturation protein CgeB